jgi:hypothetical protein
VVRYGPKRPPVAIGMAADGSGVLRVGVTDGAWTEDEWATVVDMVRAVAPGLVLQQVPVLGPPVSIDLRAAIWAEAAVVAACLRATGSLGPAPLRDVPVEVISPGGGRAVARCLPDDSLIIEVAAGEVLDEVVLRSYCVGSAHQALGWVRSEGVAVDADGTVHDLTMRSFGILAARSTPGITVAIGPDIDRDPVNGSDAVFAAVAAARWLADGLVPSWPTHRGRGTG